MSHTIRGAPSIIRAPIEAVWDALIDLQNYPRWNPFTVRVDSTLAVGSPALLTVQLTRRWRWRQKEIVSLVQAPHTLAWTVTPALRPLVSSTRYQQLEAVDARTTLYCTHETFRGPLVPLIMLTLGSELQRGFDSVGPALKAYVEAQQRPPS